jgi:glycosyltransferase involved in cell wall biosynthesis
MKPLITALVDTYNHEGYIEQALVSVLEQGLSPAELQIVVVDDGSTDQTPAIIQKFAPRVKPLRKKNGGQASAFNLGFAVARGEIVAFLDGDDWWAKEKLSTVADALERHPEVAAVGHGHYEFHENTNETRLRVPQQQTLISMADREATRLAARERRFLLPSALTVRRKVLEWIMPLPEEMVFIADVPLQAAALVMGTLILEQPLFYYRYHAQNLYSVDPSDAAKLSRKYEMTELVCERLFRRLVQLGVPKESVSEFLDGVWVEAKRFRLGRLGGSRLEAFRTERQALRAGFPNPSIGYRLFRYLITAATLLLPVRSFYKVRNWYAEKDLGRYRDRLLKADVKGSDLRV